MSKTVSEEKFERYLGSRGVPFEFEPEIHGSSQRADYRLQFKGVSFLVEVKEFVGNAGGVPPVFAAYDPYPPIRKKIDAARKKFRKLKDDPCALLLHNVSGHLIRIDRPEIVMGAMLGDLGFQFRVDRTTGRAIEEPQQAFLGRGKMVDFARKQPRNTTIGALLVLDEYPLGVKRHLLEERRLAQEKGRRLTEEELAPLWERTGETVLRVKLHENPYARKPFPREMFQGPFDEHWVWREDGNLERGFIGAGLDALEAVGEF